MDRAGSSYVYSSIELIKNKKGQGRVGLIGRRVRVELCSYKPELASTEAVTVL